MSRPQRPEHLRGTRHIDPHRVIRTAVDDLGALVYGTSTFHDEMEKADPEVFREVLPRLRASLAELSRFVAFVEHRAEETPPATCAACGSRFYPSRSDARYCSGRCRMRAHRSSASPAADSRRTADKVDPA